MFYGVKSGNKYHAVKATYDGLVFDSKLELNRYMELKLLERAGKITGLQRQIKYVLIDKSKYGREISYIADFQYVESGKLIIEDTKSIATKTRVYLLKKRLMAEKYGIIISEIYR